MNADNWTMEKKEQWFREKVLSCGVLPSVIGPGWRNRAAFERDRATVLIDAANKIGLSHTKARKLLKEETETAIHRLQRFRAEVRKLAKERAFIKRMYGEVAAGERPKGGGHG